MKLIFEHVAMLPQCKEQVIEGKLEWRTSYKKVMELLTLKLIKTKAEQRLWQRGGVQGFGKDLRNIVKML